MYARIYNISDRPDGAPIWEGELDVIPPARSFLKIGEEAKSEVTHMVSETIYHVMPGTISVSIVVGQFPA